MAARPGAVGAAGPRGARGGGPRPPARRARQRHRRRARWTSPPRWPPPRRPREDPEPNDDTRPAPPLTPAVALPAAPRRPSSAGARGLWRDPRDGFRVRAARGRHRSPPHLAAGRAGATSTSRSGGRAPRPAAATAGLRRAPGWWRRRSGSRPSDSGSRLIVPRHRASTRSRCRGPRARPRYTPLGRITVRDDRAPRASRPRARRVQNGAADEHHPRRPRPPPTSPIPALYINRELSWLDFNARVLALARDPEMPLLERCKFLAIFSSNLDEFFMVRVAAVQDALEAGRLPSTPDQLPRDEVLDRVAERVRELTAEQSRIWSEEIRPALAADRHRGRALHRAHRRRAPAHRRPVRPRGLPGPHAARRRPGAAVPLHLRPVAEPRPAGARPGEGRDALRPHQGAAAAAALPAGRTTGWCRSRT